MVAVKEKPNAGHVSYRVRLDQSAPCEGRRCNGSRPGSDCSTNDPDTRPVAATPAAHSSHGWRDCRADRCLDRVRSVERAPQPPALNPGCGNTCSCSPGGHQLAITFDCAGLFFSPFFASIRMLSNGEGGIRTHGRLPFKRFRVVRFRPLSHLSRTPQGQRHFKDRWDQAQSKQAGNCGGHPRAASRCRRWPANGAADAGQENR
jgi:hypothetical protein